MVTAPDSGRFFNAVVEEIQEKLGDRGITNDKFTGRKGPFNIVFRIDIPDPPPEVRLKMESYWVQPFYFTLGEFEQIASDLLARKIAQAPQIGDRILSSIIYTNHTDYSYAKSMLDLHPSPVVTCFAAVYREEKDE